MQFDSEILELAELTSSVPTLEEALSKLSSKRGDLANGTRPYRPPDSHPNKFHKIELSTVDKKLTIHARKGYFSK